MLRLFVPIVLTFFLVTLAACAPEQAPGEPPLEPTPTLAPDQPVPTATPSRPEEPAEEAPSGQAYIDNIEIRILESFPVQVQAVVQGHLSDPCTVIEEIKVERQEDTFTINIVTYREPDVICIQILEPFEEVVSLDVVGLEAGVYTVEANNVTETFELAVDNVP